ncbi:MAG: glycosyltransferase family 4 protein [Planctomycetota bacterium]
MRILVTVGNWKRTGPVEPALDLAVALAGRGHDVRVHTGVVPPHAEPWNTAAQAATDRGLAHAPGRPRLAKHGAPWRDLLDARRLRASLKLWRPDVVLTTLRGDHRLAVRAARGDVPVARLLFAGPAARFDGRDRRALRGTAAVFTFAEGLSDLLAPQGVDRARVHVIEPPLDVARLRALAASGGAPRARYGVPSDVPLFGIVARHQRHRRFDLLWDALKQLREAGRTFRFAVPGRGTASAEVVGDPIARLGLAEHVIQPGYVVGAAYASLLAAWDGFVFLVPGSDPTCRALREAMALGVPPVVTSRGLLPSYVEDGVVGRVLPEETPQALAAVLGAWIDDVVERRRLGAAAAELAARRFDARHVAARVEGVLEELR